MTLNLKPDDEMFTYNMSNLPLGFVEPTCHVLKDFNHQNNSLTRIFFKLLRNETNVRENTIFCNFPITAGEFSILFLRERKRL
jgi:hypothetical protein